jgi:histidyl-tRNA synthetase
MAELGGQPLSGIGFGLGVDRTVLAAAAEGLVVGNAARCAVYGIPLGAAASRELAVLAGRLRAAGIRVDRSYGDRGLKAALRTADASGARVALVLGDRDLEQGTVMVKDLMSGDQQAVALPEVEAAVSALLAVPGSGGREKG